MEEGGYRRGLEENKGQNDKDGKCITLYYYWMESYIPAWASGPSEILRYCTCLGSLVQDRGFESLRNFRKGRFKCLGSRAVANSHAAG